MGTMGGGHSAAVWRIILAAFCWWLLVLIPEILYGVALGAGLFRGAEEARRVIVNVADFASIAIVLFAAFVQGRSIGGGDPWAGIGYAPIARIPMVISMATLVAVYVLLIDSLTLTYSQNPARLRQIFEFNAWLGIYVAFRVIILGPISEELFFRGWLWVGLRKHWSPLATAAATGGMWLMVHLDVSLATPIRLLPLAIVLSFARHLGGSVRASIALHALYNSIHAISPWLFLAPA